MSKTALLVIDVQLGMFTDFGPPYKGRELLRNLQQLLAAARASRIPVVYVQHCGDEGALRKGSPGWVIHPHIAPQRGEPVVRKRHSDSFYRTRLEAVLKKLRVRRLILCGMQSDFCVDTTCRSAFSHDYQVVLVSDAHTTLDNEVIPANKIVAHHNRILRGFARIAPTAEIVSEMKHWKSEPRSMRS